VTIVFPDAAKALGNTSTILVDTIADETAPKVTELTGTGALNASCYLYGDPTVTRSAARGDKPRRSCETKARQGWGVETTELGDIQYVVDPQGDDTDDPNKVKTALPDYSEKYVVLRRGKPAKTDNIVVGDKVDIHLVELGPKNNTKTGDTDQDEFSVTQGAAVIESWFDVAVVAGP
jgi:hypothetical protein